MLRRMKVYFFTDKFLLKACSLEPYLTVSAICMFFSSFNNCPHLSTTPFPPPTFLRLEPPAFPVGAIESAAGVFVVVLVHDGDGVRDDGGPRSISGQRLRAPRPRLRRTSQTQLGLRSIRVVLHGYVESREKLLLLLLLFLLEKTTTMMMIALLLLLLLLLLLML